MPWGRLDDSLYDHPKLDHLPGEHAWPDRLAAVGLDCLAISWCNRFLTDGHVPRNRVEKLGGTIELADLLVTAGLWEPASGGYQIHDFLVYNDSRAQIIERREKEARRKADWRATKAEGKRPAGSPTGTPNGSSDDVPGGVPPSVPPGQVDNPVDMSRDVSRRPSRDSSRANPPARIPSRPVPSESRERAPTAGARARGAAAPDMSNGQEPDTGVTLTKAQLAAWSSFGPEWDAVKAAWLAKGLRLPPAGDPDDDDTSQRGLLYQVLDARPTDVARWISMAPGGSARKVIDWVLAQWHEVRAEAGADDPEEWFAPPSRAEAAESLGKIMERMR